MERSWLVSAVGGIAALGAGRVSTAHALSMLPAGCVFLSGIVLGWWACCKVYLNDSGGVQQGAAPEGMRSFTGTYRDPQKDEEWVIREAGMVSLRCGQSCCDDRVIYCGQSNDGCWCNGSCCSWCCVLSA